MGKIEAVLFDFDGTIMDTNDIILRSWRHLFKEIRGEDPDESMLLATFGEPLELTMRNFFGDDEAALKRNIAVYRNFQEESFEKDIKLFPGIYDVLIKLRGMGYRTALVTSRLSHTTRIGIEKFKLNMLFDTVVTADDCRSHKPDPEPVNIALERLGLLPEQAVMVGDTRVDIECAYRAGVGSVLVGWSAAMSGRTEACEGARPDYIIETPEDIFGVVASDNRPV